MKIWLIVLLLTAHSSLAGNLSTYPETRPKTPAPAIQMQRITPKVAAPNNSVDSDLQELQRIQEQNAAIMKQMNALNPSDPSASPNANLPTLPNVSAITENPIAQKLAGLAKNPEFLPLAIKLTTHPDRFKLLYFEIAWIIFTIIFRGWFFSSPRTWGKTLVLRLGVNVVFITVSSLAIPTYIYGSIWPQLLKLFYQQLMS